MTTKINVLQVIPKLGYGGAETGCYDIAHFLAEKECGSFIATSGGELLKYVKKNKVGIFRLPVHTKNPFLINKSTKLLPIKPRPPVTKTFCIIFFTSNLTLSILVLS